MDADDLFSAAGAAKELTLAFGTYSTSSSAAGTCLNPTTPASSGINALALDSEMRITVDMAANGDLTGGTVRWCSEVAGAEGGSTMATCLAGAGNDYIAAGTFAGSVVGGVFDGAITWADADDRNARENYLCINYNGLGVTRVRGKLVDGTSRFGLAAAGSAVAEMLSRNTNMGAATEGQYMNDAMLKLTDDASSVVVTLTMEGGAVGDAFAFSGDYSATSCGLTVKAGTNAASVSGFKFAPTSSYNYATTCAWPVFGGSLTVIDPEYPCTGPATFECGNGVLEGAEACDDGNIADNDGCDHNCAIETAAANLVYGIDAYTTLISGTTEVCNAANDGGELLAASCICQGGTEPATAVENGACWLWPRMTLSNLVVGQESHSGRSSVTSVDVVFNKNNGALTDFIFKAKCFDGAMVANSIMGHERYSASASLACTQVQMELIGGFGAGVHAFDTVVGFGGTSQVQFTADTKRSGTVWVELYIGIGNTEGGNTRYHSVRRLIAVNFKSISANTLVPYVSLANIAATERTPAQQAFADGVDYIPTAASIVGSTTFTVDDTAAEKQRLAIEVTDASAGPAIATSFVTNNGRAKFSVQSSTLTGATAFVEVTPTDSVYKMCFLSTKTIANGATVKYIATNHHNSGVDGAAQSWTAITAMYDSTRNSRRTASINQISATVASVRGAFDLSAALAATIVTEGTDPSLKVLWTPANDADQSGNRAITAIRISESSNKVTDITIEAGTGFTVSATGSNAGSNKVYVFTNADGTIPNKVTRSASLDFDFTIDPCVEHTDYITFTVQVDTAELSAVGGTDVANSNSLNINNIVASFTPVVDGPPLITDANVLTIGRGDSSAAWTFTTDLTAAMAATTCDHAEVVNNVKFTFDRDGLTNGVAQSVTVSQGGVTVIPTGAYSTEGNTWNLATPATSPSSQLSTITLSIDPSFSTCAGASTICAQADEAESQEDRHAVSVTSACAAKAFVVQRQALVVSHTVVGSGACASGTGTSGSPCEIVIAEDSGLQAMDFFNLKRTGTSRTEKITKVELLVTSTNPADHGQHFSIVDAASAASATSGCTAAAMGAATCEWSGANINSVGVEPATGFYLAALYSADSNTPNNVKISTGLHFNSRLVTPGSATTLTPTSFKLSTTVTDCLNGPVATSDFYFNVIVTPDIDACDTIYISGTANGPEHNNANIQEQSVAQGTYPWDIAVTSTRGAPDETHTLVVETLETTVKVFVGGTEVSGVNGLASGATLDIVCTHAGATPLVCVESSQLRIEPFDPNVAANINIKVKTVSGSITADDQHAPDDMPCYHNDEADSKFFFAVTPRPVFGSVTIVSSPTGDALKASNLDFACTGASCASYDIRRTVAATGVADTIFARLVITSASADVGGNTNCFGVNGLSVEDSLAKFKILGTTWTGASQHYMAWGNGQHGETHDKTMRIYTTDGNNIVTDTCYVTVAVEVTSSFQGTPTVFTQQGVSPVDSDVTFTHSAGTVTMATTTPVNSPVFSDGGHTVTLTRADASGENHNAVTGTVTVSWGCETSGEIDIVPQVCVGAACVDGSSTVQWTNGEGGDKVLTIKSKNADVIGAPCVLSITSSTGDVAGADVAATVNIQYSVGDLDVVFGTSGSLDPAAAGGAFVAAAGNAFGVSVVDGGFDASGVGAVLRITRSAGAQGTNANNVLRVKACIAHDVSNFCFLGADGDVAIDNFKWVADGITSTGSDITVDAGVALNVKCATIEWQNNIATARRLGLIVTSTATNADHWSGDNSKSTTCTVPVTITVTQNAGLGTQSIIANPAQDLTVSYDICDAVGTLTDTNAANAIGTIDATAGYRYYVTPTGHGVSRHSASAVFLAQEEGDFYSPERPRAFISRFARVGGTDGLKLQVTFAQDTFADSPGLHGTAPAYLEGPGQTALSTIVQWADGTDATQETIMSIKNDDGNTVSLFRCGTMSVSIHADFNTANYADRVSQCAYKIPDAGDRSWKTGVITCIQDEDVEYLDTGPTGGSHAFDFASSMSVTSLGADGTLKLNLCVPHYSTATYGTDRSERTMNVVASIGKCPDVTKAVIDVIATEDNSANEVDNIYDLLGGSCSTLPHNYDNDVFGDASNDVAHLYSDALNRLNNPEDNNGDQCASACDTVTWANDVTSACGIRYPTPSHSSYMSFAQRQVSGGMCMNCYKFEARLDQIRSCPARCKAANTWDSSACAAGSDRYSHFIDDGDSEAGAGRAVEVDATGSDAVVYKFDMCTMAFGKFIPGTAAAGSSSTGVIVQTSEAPVQISVLKSLSGHVALVGVHDKMQLTVQASYDTCAVCTASYGPKTACGLDPLKARLRLDWTADVISSAGGTVSGIARASDILAWNTNRPTDRLQYCYGAVAGGPIDAEVTLIEDATSVYGAPAGTVRSKFSWYTDCLNMKSGVNGDGPVLTNNFHTCADSGTKSKNVFDFAVKLTTCNNVADLESVRANPGAALPAGCSVAAAAVNVQFDLAFEANVPTWIDQTQSQTVAVTVETYKDHSGTALNPVQRLVDFSAGQKYGPEDTVYIAMRPEHPMQYDCYDMGITDSLIAKINDNAPECLRDWVQGDGWGASCGTQPADLPNPGTLVDTGGDYGGVTYAAGDSTIAQWIQYCAVAGDRCDVGGAVQAPITSGFYVVRHSHGTSHVDLCKDGPDSDNSQNGEMCTADHPRACDKPYLPDPYHATGTISDSFNFPASSLTVGSYAMSIRALLDYCPSDTGCGESMTRRRLLSHGTSDAFPSSGRRLLGDVYNNASTVTFANGGFQVTSPDGTVFTVQKKADTNPTFMILFIVVAVAVFCLAVFVAYTWKKHPDGSIHAGLTTGVQTRFASGRGNAMADIAVPLLSQEASDEQCRARVGGFVTAPDSKLFF